MLDVRLLAVLLALGLLALGGFSARAQAPAAAPTPLVDMSKVTDPKTRAALEEIARKTATINEIVIKDDRMNDPLNPFACNRPAQNIQRRSGESFSAIDGLNVDNTKMIVQSVWTINDGKTMWFVEKGLAKPQGNPALLVIKVDLVKIKAAGVKNDLGKMGADFEHFVMDLSDKHLSRLKLVGETPETWTFLFTMEPAEIAANEEAAEHGTTSQTITVSKATGIIIKYVANGKVSAVETMDQVTVNPNPPVPDAYFKYTPPADAVVLDMTDEMLKQERGKGAPDAKPAAAQQSPAAAAPATAPAPVARLNLALITDPKVRAAVEEIQRKTAAIKEIIIQDYRTNETGSVITGAHPKQLIIRADGQSFTHAANLNNQHKNVLTQEMWVFNNGKNFWNVQKGMDTVQKKPVTIVSGVDLVKVRAAGVKSELMALNSLAAFVNPFINHDLSTLKLVSETPEAWNFTANISTDGPEGREIRALRITSERLSISKKSGLTIKSATDGPNPITESLDQVTVNPDPPVPDSYFNYTPSASAFVVDMTDQEIQKGLARMKGAPAPSKAFGR